MSFHGSVQQDDTFLLGKGAGGFARNKIIFQREGCLPSFSVLLRQLKESIVVVVWVLIKVFSIHLSHHIAFLIYE